MNIKDYLHLYLGCKFVMKIIGTDNYTAEMTFGVEALCATFSGKKQDLIEPILILRPLSDMTKKENKELSAIIGVDTDKEVHIWTPDQFIWLLSKHFDLFGLIENGLAIDKTTLNQTT